MYHRFISISFISFFFLSSLFFFIIACLVWACTVLFDPKLKALHLFSCFWASVYLWVMPFLSVTVSGREKIEPGRTYIVVSNHQSQLDILVAFRLFFHFKWLSKAEVFKIPFIGWNMVLNRYIKLKRGNKKSIKQLLTNF